MKHFLIIFVTFLLVTIGCSCNSNKGEEDPNVIMEDIFLVDVLVPDENVKETIGESLLSIIPTLIDDYEDTICINIHGSANWNTSENNDPSSIKIINVDTCRFYITINNGTDQETLITWSRLSGRPLLRTIMTILDTGSYSLHCVNYDESLEKVLDSYRDYYDPIVYTDIDFEMYLRK